MNILVITPGYPVPEKSMGMYFVHSRNLYYRDAGFDVTVLNFGASSDYEFDGIRVISLKTYEIERFQYDLLVSHASNIRNQYAFIKKYGDSFQKKIFIFHGGEILHINKYYPKPYEFKHKGVIHRVFQELYDGFKIALWKRYYLNNIDSIRLVFVSNWLYNQFKKEFSLVDDDLKGNYAVISNSVGAFFSSHYYEPHDEKYDMIMIRGVLDESKYCVDLFCKLAEDCPDLKLCLIGDGDYFKYNSLPSNIDFYKRNLSHGEMKKYLDQSKCAFMPTREDTQGLMACELATYGIPLITSDIDVCKEVFDSCPNAILVNNDTINGYDLLQRAQGLQLRQKWNKYLPQNTIEKEISFIEKYVKNEQ